MSCPTRPCSPASMFCETQPPRLKPAMHQAMTRFISSSPVCNGSKFAAAGQSRSIRSIIIRFAGFLQELCVRPNAARFIQVASGKRFRTAALLFSRARDQVRKIGVAVFGSETGEMPAVILADRYRVELVFRDGHRFLVEQRIVDKAGR